jgi:hypothetical protein
MVLWALVLVFAVFGTIGCGGSSAALSLKSLPPADAAAAIMEKLDSNHDGKLLPDELGSAPGLATGAKRVDSNGDGAITIDELLKRLEQYANGASMIGLTVTVSVKGRPLAGASVKLTPDAFMGAGAQAFTATTDQSGSCEPDGERDPMPGVPVGYYQVHIAHTEAGVDAHLGCEVASDASGNRLEFRL